MNSGARRALMASCDQSRVPGFSKCLASRLSQPAFPHHNLKKQLSPAVAADQAVPARCRCASTRRSPDGERETGLVRRLVSPILGIVLFLGWSTSGCTLFPEWSESESAFRSSLKPGLAPIRPQANAIQLEILLVDRWADDPVLVRKLWDEVGRLACLNGNERSRLQQNGIWVGHVGASPPPSIQALLEAPGQESGKSTAGRVSGRFLGIPSGQDSEILLGDLQESMTFTLQDGDKSEERTFPQARAVLRVRPDRLQEGWARFTFMPEVHHGDARLRPAATTDGWAYQAGQMHQVLHQLEFTLDLNVGEIAVITSGGKEADSVGKAAFQYLDDGRARQRVLLIRLVDLGQSGNESLFP